MESKNNLLEIKNKLKKKKPKFTRQQIHKYARLENNDTWRKPKGSGSKTRKKRRGKKKMPNIGYRAPKPVRGLTKEGLKRVVIKNKKELEGVDKKTEIVVLHSNLGLKKRLELLVLIKEGKFKVDNVKDVDKELKEIEDYLNERKKKREKLIEKRKENLKKKKETKKDKEKEKDKDKKSDDLEKKITETKEDKKEEKVVEKKTETKKEEVKEK